jgi:hypothetical protein
MNRVVSHLPGLVLAALLLATVAPVAAQTVPPSQIVVEFGWAAPRGDLADDYPGTRLGLGAGDGLLVGFRWRYQMSPAWSLSPAFHFVDYRNFTSTADVIGDYRISASTLRYTLEAMYMPGDPSRTVRWFAAASAGLYRNRVTGYEKTAPTAFEETVNTLGLAVRGGLRIGQLELSAMYGMNRFSTWHLFRNVAEDQYDWDSVSVCAGWVMPFSDGPPKAKTK